MNVRVTWWGLGLAGCLLVVGCTGSSQGAGLTTAPPKVIESNSAASSSSPTGMASTVPAPGTNPPTPSTGTSTAPDPDTYTTPTVVASMAGLRLTAVTPYFNQRCPALAPTVPLPTRVATVTSFQTSPPTTAPPTSPGDAQIVGLQVCRVQATYGFDSYQVRVPGNGLWSAISVARPTGAIREQLLKALAQPSEPPETTQPVALLSTCLPTQYPTIQVAIRSGSSVVVRNVILPIKASSCGYVTDAVTAALNKIPDTPDTLIPTTRLLSEGAVQAGCEQNLAIPFGGQYDHTVAGATPSPTSATVGICVFSNPGGRLVRFGRAPTEDLTRILSSGITKPQQYCPASLELSVEPVPATATRGLDLADLIVVEQTGCHRILARGRVIGHLSDQQVRQLEALATDPEEG